MRTTRDSKGHMKPEIWRVPLADFVYPPRFTNIWYDGK